MVISGFGSCFHLAACEKQVVCQQKRSKLLPVGQKSRACTVASAPSTMHYRFTLFFLWGKRLMRQCLQAKQLEQWSSAHKGMYHGARQHIYSLLMLLLVMKPFSSPSVAARSLTHSTPALPGKYGFAAHTACSVLLLGYIM